LPDWLGSFKKKDRTGETDQVLELMVLEGEDSGRQFTVDANNVAIARGVPRTGQPGAILLQDPTISGHQAMIRRSGGTTVIEHHRGATNPTLVNGKVITTAQIEPGDRIQMGRVVLEVRTRGGFALGTLIDSTGERVAEPQPEASPDTPEDSGADAHSEAPTEDRAIDPALQPDGAAAEGALPHTGETTEVRPVVLPGYSLVIVSGVEGLEGKRHPIESPGCTIGRDANAGVQIDVRAVSRLHAEVVWERDRLFVVHRSGVNQTFVNGVPVRERVEVFSGDQIQLADCVVLRLDHDGPTAPEPPMSAAVRPQSKRDFDPNQTSLQVRMEEKMVRDREIEEKYAVEGSFLDVDVVGSYSMKAESKRPEHIIVSFERWRAWIGAVIEEFGGMVLNSNGDELMCFFESTMQCVHAGSTILSRLAQFNEDQNELPNAFRLRIGIHTGSSLVDRKRGVAYSEVLDVAGHLQKEADENGLLISEPTFRALPEGVPFEVAGRLERENIVTYRMVRPPGD